MNTYNVKDQMFIKSSSYQQFLRDNPSRGYLSIRAYAASQAIPISGLRIVVSTIVDNSRVIFFEGATNISGVIEGISLPAPLLAQGDLTVPNKLVYQVEATYGPNNVSKVYDVNMYENISVIQNISVAPNMDLETGGL